MCDVQRARTDREVGRQLHRNRVLSPHPQPPQLNAGGQALGHVNNLALGIDPCRGQQHGLQPQRAGVCSPAYNHKRAGVCSPAYNHRGQGCAALPTTTEGRGVQPCLQPQRAGVCSPAYNHRGQGCAALPTTTEGRGVQPCLQPQRAGVCSPAYNHRGQGCAALPTTTEGRGVLPTTTEGRGLGSDIQWRTLGPQRRGLSPCSIHLSRSSKLQFWCRGHGSSQVGWGQKGACHEV